MKTIIYQNKKMYLKVSTYREKTLALNLIEAESGEPWMTITLCIDEPLPYGIAAIKSYAENEGVYKWLFDNRIIHATINKIHNGYVEIPIVSVNMQTLSELDETGVQEYRKRNKIKIYPFTKFDLGRIDLSQNVKCNLTENEVGSALVRHIGNDWGDCTKDHWKENDLAVKNGDTIHSVYISKSGMKFCVITEPDRSVTNVCFPEER